MKLYNFHFKFSDQSQSDVVRGAESILDALALLSDYDRENIQNIEFIAERRDTEKIIWTVSEGVESLLGEIDELMKAANQLYDAKLIKEESKKRIPAVLEVNAECIESLTRLMGVVGDRVDKVKQYLDIMDQLARLPELVFPDNGRAKRVPQ